MSGRKQPAVLISGGAGYIGSHTCKALARAGYLPVVYDDLSRGHEWAVKWGPLEIHDLGDTKALRDVIHKHEITAVMHFAGYAHVAESMAAPEIYFRNNVTNSLGLLEVMSEAGVDVIVFSSTCATYGNPLRLPIPDDHPRQPINPYGESKRIIEDVLGWYGQIHDLSWVVLRYFNAAGSDPEGELGEVHDPETHLIPLVLRTALGQQPLVEVFGTDYDTPDGTAIRDFIHVTDLADAHVRALEYLLARGTSTAFNLGTGHGHSVRGVIRTVERITGRTIPVQERPRRPGDPPVLVADARRATEHLGWVPRLSDLETIVESALRWHRTGPAQRCAPAIAWESNAKAPTLFRERAKSEETTHLDTGTR
jgi:UDP-glucose-4-epimerase GalE